MSLKCKWVTGSQKCATVHIFCATPSARVDSMSSLHCKPTSSRTTCRSLWSSRSYLSFWKRPTPSIAHDENFGRKQPDLPSLSARTCAAKRQREGVCLTGSRARSNFFRFQKKWTSTGLQFDLWLFELCRPSQFAPTATVLNFTRSFLHLGPPAAADSPAAPGWAGEVLHRSIPTSTYQNSDFFRMFNEGSFKFFAIRIRSR